MISCDLTMLVVQQCSIYFLVMLDRVVALVLFLARADPIVVLLSEIFVEIPKHVQHDVCIMLTRHVICEDHLLFIDGESGTERFAIPW